MLNNSRSNCFRYILCYVDISQNIFFPLNANIIPKKLMLDFSTFAEFSRTNCIGICAFLVPANLLTTLLTVILAILGRSNHQIWQSVSLASIFATFMIYHVYTWFMIGVVMLPTYILLALAITCLLTNFVTVILHKRYFCHQNISQNA
ncbi:hypothetical protein NOS3756_44110 [Nostoc sp. NIES-3756]|nr:hypothetical protein NOS3756_44110 [Nostoc sp. NIES-3756]BAY36813.1 hypothetical protein NIES2111_11440 [Nostoc sp. NIES-2111]